MPRPNRHLPPITNLLAATTLALLAACGQASSGDGTAPDSATPSGADSAPSPAADADPAANTGTGTGTAVAVAGKGLPAGALRVQRAEIVDQGGFEKPMLAATMMVPAGWQVKGQVEWKTGQRCGPAHALRLQAVAPDGSAAIELVPGDGWGRTNYGAPLGECPQADISSTRAYLEAWVQQHRPGARWLDYRLRPDKSRPASEQTHAGGSMSQRVESGQALIAYDQGGQEVRETLVANVAFTQSQFNMGGRSMQSMQGQSMGVLAWRAPAGALDLRQFDAVWATLRAEDDWQARINAGYAAMARDNQATQAQIAQIRADTARETMQHIVRRGEIMAQTRADVAAIHAGTVRAREQSNERMHTDSVRTLREVQGYRDPRSGGVVELSSHYNHAWQLRDGSYVLTDSPSFDPGRDLGVQGQQLVRTRER